MSQGEVTSVQGSGYYCDGNELVPQSDSGPCTVVSECLSGSCIDGACISLHREEKGFFAGIWAWFTGLF